MNFTPAHVAAAVLLALPTISCGKATVATSPGDLYLDRPAKTQVGAPACIAPLPLRFFPISPDSETPYATFGSYQQRVVSSSYGIFFTYKATYELLETGEEAGEWHLKRSTDGGRTFTTVYKEDNSSLAPPLETDSEGNIYMISYRSRTETAFLKFSPSNGFTAPSVTHTVRDAGRDFSAKVGLFLDEPRQQMYAFTHMNGMFYVFDFSGMVKTKYGLVTSLSFANGGTGYVMYPLLYVDEDGVVYAAWTNQMHKEMQTKVYGDISNRYTSIHFILSRDGGETWENPNGAKLTIPVISDEHGPATMVSRSDEVPGPWLCSFLVNNGRLHFLYNYKAYREDGTIDPPRNRMHYVRYDLLDQKLSDYVYAPNPAGQIPGVPSWGGARVSINGPSGFMTKRRRGNEIYAVGSSAYRIGILVTDDDGYSWRDVAQSDPQVGYMGYGPRSITGAREVTEGGSIIGILTHQVDETSHSVWFFDLLPACQGFGGDSGGRFRDVNRP